MPAGHGLRARTRDKFSRAFRGKGYIPLSVYLRTYKIGDYVDIKVNSAVQKVSNLCILPATALDDIPGCFTAAMQPNTASPRRWQVAACT